MDDDATGLPITSYQAMIPPPASPPETRRKSRNTLRERVGRLFAAGGRQSSARSKSVERLSLANFTFADSKIGSLMLVQREQEQAAQVACRLIRSMLHFGQYLLSLSLSLSLSL